MLALNPGKATGVKVTPKDQVTAVSGFKSGLPSITSPHWPETHCGMALGVFPVPYCAAVTPVFAHSFCDAVGKPAHGSVVKTSSCPYDPCKYSSIRFGARTARSKEKRSR